MSYQAIQESLGGEQVLNRSINSDADLFAITSEDFKLWLSTPCRPLGDQKPQDLLLNGFGIDMVEDQLERMEYGIY